MDGMLGEPSHNLVYVLAVAELVSPPVYPGPRNQHEFSSIAPANSSLQQGAKDGACSASMLSHSYTNRTSFTLLPRQTVGAILASAAADEEWG